MAGAGYCRDTSWSTSTRSGLQQTIQQRVDSPGKRFCHGDAAPRESFLQMFGQQQPATPFGGGSQDHGIPDGELVVHNQIAGSYHHGGGSAAQRETVAPRQDRAARDN